MSQEEKSGRSVIATVQCSACTSVRAADQIVVIHEGEIVEHGNNESLLALNGQYASLFKLQAKGYQ